MTTTPEYLAIPMNRTMTCPECGYKSGVEGRIAEYCSCCGRRICKVLFDGYVFVVREEGKERTIVIPARK